MTIYNVRVIYNINDYVDNQYASFLDFTFYDFDSLTDFMVICFENNLEVIINKQVKEG